MECVNAFPQERSDLFIDRLQVGYGREIYEACHIIRHQQPIAARIAKMGFQGLEL